MQVLAALPRPEFEVGMTALASFFVGFGLIDFIRGSVPGAERSTARNVRLMAAGQILVGIGVAFTAFRIKPEPDCGQCGGGPWGGTWAVVLMGVWLAWLGLIVAINLRRYKK